MAKYHELMKPILDMFKSGEAFELRQVCEFINLQFPLSFEEIKQKLSCGKKPDISEDVRLALSYLKKAGLVDNPARGIYSITNDGLEVLTENPEIIDIAYLTKFDSFRVFRQSHLQKQNYFENGVFEKLLLVCAPVKVCISYRSEIANHLHYSDFISSSCDAFVSELIDAIRNFKTHEFKQKHTGCKVFILHDIESLAGKEATQEELYNIIQARIDRNLKTVILSSKSPNDLSEILSERFYELLTIDSIFNQIPDPFSESHSPKLHNGNFTMDRIDIQSFNQTLLEVKKQLENNEIDEIPFYARPKMLNFDFDNNSYVVVSYSRKDFREVYLLLAQLYNEGYRFWYDNGMKGTKEWLEEYKDKFQNPNCLGTITFFSNNYISDSTKEELEVIYSKNGYEKRNIMISLIPLNGIDPDEALVNAISHKRITISNAHSILPVLTRIINEEKKKTIHRYNNGDDIPFLVDKIGIAFNIRD